MRGMRLFGIMLITALCLLGCKSIQYVPVETVKIEYVNSTDTFIKKDSIYVKDSVFVYKAGDTVVATKWKYIYQDRWRETIKIDTVITRDSIQVPYPVEKEFTFWEKTKMDIGGLALVLCGVLLLIIVSLFIKNRG